MGCDQSCAHTPFGVRFASDLLNAPGITFSLA